MMGIGTSLGAYHEDEFEYNQAAWNPSKFNADQGMIVSPPDMYTNKDLSKSELDPSTGLGIEVSSPEVDWSKLNQPLGSIKGTGKEDTPVVAKTASPLVTITEGDISEATNVAMGSGPGVIAGVNSQAMEKAFRWFKGSDNKYRYELSDEGMKLKDKDWRYGEAGKLSDFVDHPELFKAYPQLAETTFKVADKEADWIGGFYPKKNMIEINPDKVKSGDAGLMDVILHEMQHAVQKIEGFSQGSNPDHAFKQATDALIDKMKKTKDPATKTELMDIYLDIHDNAKKFSQYMYLRNPGEVEANIVASRRQLTDAQRKMVPPQEFNKSLEGEISNLHGGPYVAEFNYP